MISIVVPIKQVPDIITTGDLHKVDVDIYNNILILLKTYGLEFK